MISDEELSCEDSCGDEDVRHLERWAPLGATGSSSPPGNSDEPVQMSELERLNRLEEEQELLNMSLLSLTTHFAQVQFRLKQIVDAPNNEKEVLLKELEEFAFKGIPDVNCCSEFKKEKKFVDESLTDKEHDELMIKQRQKQMELITQLKSQLEDLETYAYETGEATVPTSKVLEKQKIVIDQLMTKLSLRDLEHLDKLSSEELRETVDRAIGQILYPGKVKEKLVDQLKTQITDLERFIEFLQGEQTSSTEDPSQCTCKIHGHDETKNGKRKGGKHFKKMENSLERKNLREQTLSLMRHAATVLQIFAITQLSCGNEKDFQRNLLKRTTRGNHWGDLRARLEMAVSNVIELCQRSRVEENNCSSRRKRSSTASFDEALNEDYDMEVVNAVRKDLAMSLRDLLQHGLVELEQSQSLVPFGCLSSRNKNNFNKNSNSNNNNNHNNMLHAWQLFLKYYQIKHGRSYTDAPARRLSMAFGLEMVGGKPMTPKQTLLTAIEEVSSSHQPLKRNEDSQFKAFICLALNQKKLVAWLRILLRCDWLIEYYYQPWSYVIKTGFDDALVSLDALTKVDFDLPADLAIRPFQNIRDAF